MKLIDIKNYLNEKYQGKEYGTVYSGGTNAFSIGIAVRDYLKDQGIKEVSFRDEKNTTVRVSYKDHTLFELNIKKVRGDHHSRWGESYYDWAIKSIEIEGYYLTDENDLDDAIKQIEGYVAADLARANKQELEALEVLKYIMDTYNKDAYSAGWMCKYICDHKYTLAEKLKTANN